jgi:hypothetical protein
MTDPSGAVSGGSPLVRRVLAALLVAAAVAGALAACQPRPLDPKAALIAKGRDLFFNETFGGNGRTCGTCHRQEENFTLTPGFIATLPKDDPLFVAEFVPELRENFENPRLMRAFGLVQENLDGFDSLATRFTMRGIPHTFALGTSVASPAGPRTGWSGDGAPADGSLRSFAVGAVIQHFTRRLDRVPGVDFRLPTAEELDALEAFQLSLGRREDLVLPLPLEGVIAVRGQSIFMDDGLGKCNICHHNAGATTQLGVVNIGNANFNTGVEDLPDLPSQSIGERVPRDDGFRIPGDSTFNTPPLVEAADTGPFFHNNAVETIEGAVAFYSGKAFNNSPSGRFLANIDPRKVGIQLDATQTVAVAAFLRVLNALENIRQALEDLKAAEAAGFFEREKGRDMLERAGHEIDDGIAVLAGGGLHPEAVAELRRARELTERAKASVFNRRGYTRDARTAHERARGMLIREAP